MVYNTFYLLLFLQTCAVDLFSLGCLFYYILSKGSHPFGETLRRQANILCGESSLNELKGPDWSVNLQKPLIMSLISSKPDDRPPCDTILCYPVFWDSKKILAFFQVNSEIFLNAVWQDVRIVSY